ncbi:hypothetical protein ACPTG1_21285 [Pseudomonas aeruginosa]
MAETTGGNPKALTAWRTEYSSETMESWLNA